MTFIIPDATVKILYSNLDAENLAKLTDGKRTIYASNGTNKIEFELQAIKDIGISLSGVDAQVVYFTQINAHGTTLDTQTVSLSYTPMENIWDYFYAVPEYKKEAITNIAYKPGAVKVKVEIVSAVSSVQVGEMIAGESYFLGYSSPEVAAGIRDWSTFAENEETGEITVTKKAYAKTLDCLVYVPKGQFSRAFNKLTNLRATPVVAVADDVANEDALTVYALIEDFDMLYGFEENYVTNLTLSGLY